MDLEGLWRAIERSMVVVGGICAILTAYYSAGLYYGWDKQEAAKIGGATVAPIGGHMTVPVWIYALGGIGVLLLGTAWVMIVLRRKAPQIHGRMFPIETGVYVGQISISLDKLD